MYVWLKKTTQTALPEDEWLIMVYSPLSRTVDCRPTNQRQSICGGNIKRVAKECGGKCSKEEGMLIVATVIHLFWRKSTEPIRHFRFEQFPKKGGVFICMYRSDGTVFFLLEGNNTQSRVTQFLFRQLHLLPSRSCSSIFQGHSTGIAESTTSADCSSLICPRGETVSMPDRLVVSIAEPPTRPLTRPGTRE